MKRSIVIFSSTLLLAAGCGNPPRSSTAPDEGTPNINTTIIGDQSVSGSSGTRGGTSGTSGTSATGDESH